MVVVEHRPAYREQECSVSLPLPAAACRAGFRPSLDWIPAAGGFQRWCSCCCCCCCCCRPIPATTWLICSTWRLQTARQPHIASFDHHHPALPARHAARPPGPSRPPRRRNPAPPTRPSPNPPLPASPPPLVQDSQDRRLPIQGGESRAPTATQCSPPSSPRLPLADVRLAHAQARDRHGPPLV